MGEIYLEHNELAKAVPLLVRAIEEDRWIASAFAAHGKAYLKQGKPADAVRMLEQSVNLDAENLNTRYRLAIAYQELGQPEDAEREFAVFGKPSEKSAQSSTTP